MLLKPGRIMATAMAAVLLVSGLTAAPAHADAGISGNEPVATPMPDWVPDKSWPTFHFTTGDNSANQIMASSLPFNFTYTFTVAMESRRFNTSNGTICANTDVYSNKDMGIAVYADVFGVDPMVGQLVRFPAAGGTHYYCWGNSYGTGTTYYLRLSELDEGYWYEGAGAAYQ